MTGEMDFLIIFLGVCLFVLLIGILVVKFIAGTYMPFAEERDYLRMEVMRTHGNERIHWQHELRRLYLSLIPFIGVYLARRSRKRERKKRAKK